MSTAQPPCLWARIDPTGQLAVTGLPEHPHGLQADHGEPENAYAELINLALDRAEQAAGPVWLHATTPTGVWAMAVHVEGTTVPLPLELFHPTPATPPADHDDSQDTGLQGTDLESALAAVGQLCPPPAEVVLALASDPAPGVRAAAIAELSTWGDDPNVVIEADIDAEQLAGLADCRLPWVRAGVAGHPRTDPITLDRLATDSDRLVVQSLASRLDLPADLATTLSRHREPSVRAELGRNPAAAFLLAPTTPAAPATTESTRATAVAVIEPPTGDPPTRGADQPRTPPPVGGDATQLRTPPPSAPRRMRRRRLAGGIATGLLLVAGSGIAWVATDATSPPPPAAASTTSTPSRAPWHGTWLPAGPDGPTDPGAATVSGFAHTELGAAMAAAHLSVRIDPYAGPASFRSTITAQTHGGDPADLLARTQAAYRERATTAGITGGGPIPTSTGSIDGWRADGWSPDGPVTVHLLVTSATGHQVDYTIQVAWVDGDYHLIDPTRADTFVTATDLDPRTYTRF